MEEKYKLEPLAKKDIKESAKYYEEKKEGLGGEFLDEINIKIIEIINKPYSNPVFYKNVRQASSKRHRII